MVDVPLVVKGMVAVDVIEAIERRSDWEVVGGVAEVFDECKGALL